MYYIKKSDWARLEREHSDYCGRSIHDSNVRVIFEGVVPGNNGRGGTTLLFEHKHFEIVEDENMESKEVFCSGCGCLIDEDEPVCVIDQGMETERVVCESCCASLCNNGKIVQCEACGAYFAASSLHDEEIEGHSFTACPACGKDVVEALGRAEFEDEYFCPKYSVVVRAFDGSCRGYIVKAKGRHEVMKRLLEKLDFGGVAEVTIGEVLLKEDEF